MYYLTFLASLTSEAQMMSKNWGPEPLLGAILRGFKVVPLDSTGIISY